MLRVLTMGIPEPTSSVSSQWSSGHLTSGVKSSQWTEQDLDAFVKQLSNPQHHIGKIGPSKSTTTAPSSSSSPRKSSLELQPGRPKRAPLARSETDCGYSFQDHSSSAHINIGNVRHCSDSGPSSSIGNSLLSGLSGLRLIKNKKLSRSSNSNAKKYISQKSVVQDNYVPSKDEPSIKIDELSSGAMSARNASTSTGGSSSPEASDGERSDERKLSGSEVNTSTAPSSNSDKEGGKKRRFRRMLTRPLRRSQSAGCAKDVPAHAIFMGKPRKLSDKDKETHAELRKERSSEGDITHMPVFDDHVDDVDDTVVLPSSTTSTSSASSTIPSSRSSHSLGKKTKAPGLKKMYSEDVSMLTTDEFGGHPHKPKSKNYNIAKRISKHMQFIRRRHADSTVDLVDKEDARRLPDLEPAQIQSWSKSFESLLYDKSGLDLFRGFLVSEHSDENIEFWIACENYKVVKSHKQLAPLAQKIYEDYVAVQSRREVNLDSKTRTSTYESVTSDPNRQTFDDAQKRVQALMEKDSYRRFLESELYVDLAAGNLQNKS